MTTDNLLVELFVEELPPKALKKLGESFAGVLAASLRAQGLANAESVATPFASPRRLAVHLTQVAAKAGQHFLIAKSATGGDAAAKTVTRVTPLKDQTRREEIARMLAGASITEEARAAAGRLLSAAGVRA